MMEKLKLPLIVAVLVGGGALLFWQLQQVKAAAWSLAPQTTEPFFEALKQGEVDESHLSARYLERCSTADVLTAHRRRVERHGALTGWERNAASFVSEPGRDYFRLEYVLRYGGDRIPLVFEVSEGDAGPRIESSRRKGGGIPDPDC